MKLDHIQTAATFNGDYYSLIIAFTDQHAINIDGLSHEDMLQLKSCIDCTIGDD